MRGPTRIPRVRSISSALLAACLVACGIFAAGASAATETVSLGSNENTGAEPAPFLEAPAVQDPVSFTVTYTSNPIQPFYIGETLNCVRGSERPGVPEKFETFTPPYTVTIPAPTGSESCVLTAQAEPTPMTTVAGSARIEAEATRVAKSQSAPPSTKPKKKKCRKGRRLKHGKCVRKHHR